jgi:hypothetical protein
VAELDEGVRVERLAAEGIAVAVTPLGGMLTGLEIVRDGRRIAPLHRAPWVGEGAAMPEDAAPHLAVLEGDFFCAPFGRTDEAGVPAHGWPANGAWQALGTTAAGAGAVTGQWALGARVLGAEVVKEVTLRPGHPVVYQRHVLRGGEGAVPVAHHAMIRVPGGARISFSRKDFGGTPSTPLEVDPARGRSLLAYPQRFDGLGDVGLADGGRQDLSGYPWADGHEDFLTLFDPSDAGIGWSAAVAAADGFVFFAVKDAGVLRQTSLWMSNGGRSYAPWSSRHRAVLGIEESTTHFGDGRLVSAAPNALSAAGYCTALPLGGEVVVRYALGAIPVPEGWREIADIEVGDGGLTLADVGGGTARVPFDAGFLAGC